MGKLHGSLKVLGLSKKILLVVNIRPDRRNELAEFAECRWCRKKLDGKPYYMGGRAYDPVTRKQANVNFYGGFVCSRECDYRASLDLEQTMPGHGSGQTRPGSFAMQRIKENWGV